MKRKMIFAVLAFLLILQVQTVFATEWDTQEVAFMEAFKKDDLPAMEKALKERTSKTSLNALLTTLIFGNIDDHNLPSTQLLIKYGANCNTTSTYIYHFTQNGNLNVKDIKDDYHYTHYRNSLLAYAISMNEYVPNLQIIRVLLESGANMYPRDISPYEILQLQDRNIAITRLLIEKGYDINRSYREITDSNIDNYPLGWATNFRSYAIVRLLVESGAKVNATNYLDKKTAAQIAYESGEIDIYNYLKQNGAVWSPPSQVASTPPPSSQPRQTYNDSYDDYSPPPSSSRGSSSSSSSGSSWTDVGKSIADAFTPPLDSGTYGLSGTQAKIRLTGIAKSGMLSYTNKQGKTVNGYYNIDGNSMTVQAEGFTYVYTITSKTSFSGNGETWVRTGY